MAEIYYFHLHQQAFAAEFGKVVQLLVKEEPVIFTGGLFSAHGDILREYLQLQNIEFARQKMLGGELPVSRNQIYTVVGMGSYFKDNNTVRIGDQSVAYNVNIDREHINNLSHQFPHLTFEFD